MPEPMTVEPIAIIGMAGRFPGARDIDAFWANLRSGRECITTFSEAELRAAGVSEAQLLDPHYVRAKGYLEDAELFDAGFFGFSPRQAEILDPQQRVFLEVAVEALENAGYDAHRCEGAIGVFGGASFNTYLAANLHTNAALVDLVGPSQMVTSNRGDHLTTRVAYALNLHGPAVTVQTACSTSLVAVHMACQALLHGECEMALAGGVCVSAPRKSGYLHQPGGVLSPDGHCRVFDARAQGTVIGEGAGIVVLKRLTDALAAGDTIAAVIRGSAINNDGSVKVGYTAPSVDGQAAVIAEAQALGGVPPETVTYVEAHGTGTILGDPIEIAALTRVFQGSASGMRQPWCALGAVKSNIGHLDAAAGVAGLIKTILALRHRELPPTLHFTSRNPQIDFVNSPFYVNDALRSWEPSGQVPRRAGVSSFGFGGTNCHVVLEEAPPAEPSGPSRDEQVILLSAQTVTALEVATSRLAAHLQQANRPLADVAFTLAAGRSHHRHRRALACSSVGECVDLLTSLHPDRVHTGEAAEAGDRGAVFLFPGQGSQHSGMARQIWEREPVFRQALERCLRVIEAQLGVDPRQVMWAAPTATQLRETHWAQCTLFAVEWSLAQLWRSWGLEPTAMIGHSLGEYVAACLAGVFDVESALHLVIQRGRLMGEMLPGAMISVPRPEEEVQQWLQQHDPHGRRLALAAVNGPALCVVSGESAAVESLQEVMQKATQTECRRLTVSHAFHSPMMDPMLDAFGEALTRVTLAAPTLPWVSNLTGSWVGAREVTNPRYWVRHLRETVRFSAGLSCLFRETSAPLLEVGPAHVLRNLARWHPQKPAARVVLASLPAANSREAQCLHLHATLGRLWVAGAQFDHKRYFSQGHRARVPLPSYPFERTRCWVDPPVASPVRTGRRPFEEWFYIPGWRRSPRPSAVATVGDRLWLLIADECGIAERLAACLRERGASVVIHQPDAVGGTAAQYQHLFAGLASEGVALGHILHLASLTNDTESEGARERVVQRGFFSMLHLAQALGSHRISSSLELLVATNGACDVTGSEPLCPEQATILGPSRVIPHENPAVRCRCVDLALPPQAAASDLWDRLIDQLLCEATSSAPERMAAWRGHQRWVESYERVSLPALADGPVELARQGGVYLIVGGLGGIGLEIAAALARTPSVKLVLIGRSSLPPREDWSGILAGSGRDSALGRRIERIQQLSERAEVLVLTADVTDADRMAAVVSQVRQRFGAIHGVVHAAGLASGGVMQLRADVDAAAVLAPKVRGTRVLQSLLAGDSLDFFVLCSARGSLYAGLGQADYAAANAYLDAFAHTLSRTIRATTVAIDWPGWQEVGMLVEAAHSHEKASETTGELTRHPLLERRIPRGPSTCEFLTSFSASRHWVLDEHRIVGSPVLPGTAYLEMAREAVTQFCAWPAVELRNVSFLRPLVVRDGQERVVRTLLQRVGDAVQFEFSAALSTSSDTASEWLPICRGEAREFGISETPHHDIAQWIGSCDTEPLTFAAETAMRDDSGPRWRAVRRLWLGHRQLVTQLDLPAEFAADDAGYSLHPALLDCINLAAREYLAATLAGQKFFLPFSYDQLILRAPLPTTVWAHCCLREPVGGEQAETITFDTIIVDRAGRELAAVCGFSQKRVVDGAAQIRAFAGDSLLGNARPEPVRRVRDSVYDIALREGISPQEAIAALTRILAAPGLPQVIVSPTELRPEQPVPESAKPEKQESTTTRTHAAQLRPNLGTAYREPRTALERQLVALWEDLLGIAPIGVDDNFFELGGDSVQGLQLATRYRDRGLHVPQSLVFQKQSVGELAAALDQEATRQSFALLPTQRELMRKAIPMRAIVLTCQIPAISAEHLAAALEAVRTQHAALRLRCVRTAEGSICQEVLESPDPITIYSGTLSLAQARSDLLAELDPERGRTIGAALLRGTSDGALLVLAIHEFAVDFASLRTVLADLTEACTQARAGEAPRLSARGASFAEWLPELQQYVPERVGSEDQSGGEAEWDAVSNSATTVCTLDVEQTRRLVQGAAKQRLSIEELVLAALEISFGADPALAAPTFEVEHSLRELSAARFDLTQAVGPLQYAFPLRLAVPAVQGDIALADIKVRLRPALRNASQSALESGLTSRARPALRVACVGEIGAAALGGTVTDIRWESRNAAIGPPCGLRVFQLEGALHMSWQYDPQRFMASALAQRAENVREILNVLANACHERDEVTFAASDFPLANLDESSMHHFADLLRTLESATGN